MASLDKDMAGLSAKQQKRINSALEGLSGADYEAKRSELISEQKSKNDYMDSLRNKANSTQGSMPVGTTVVSGSDISKLETELRDVAEKEAKTANTCDEWSNYYCDKDSDMYKQMQEAKERAEAAAKAAQLLLQKIEDIKKFVSDADEQVKEMVISISLDELKVSATTNTNRNVSTNMLSSHKEVWNNAVNMGVVSETAREKGDTPTEEWSKGVDDVLNKMNTVNNVSEVGSNDVKSLSQDTNKVLGNRPSLKSEDYSVATGEVGCAAGTPINYSKTTYTDASTYPWDSASYQYGIIHSNTTYVDSCGIYRTQRSPGVCSDDDPICVAMGAGWLYADSAADGIFGNQVTSNAGYIYKVTLQSDSGVEKTFDVIMADAKGNSDSLIPQDHILEFEVKSDIMKNSHVSNPGGNVDFGNMFFGGEHAKIVSVESTGEHYFEGGWGAYNRV